MECRLFLFSEWCSFALQSRADTIQIEIIAAVIQCGLFTINVTPIGTGLCLLIKSCSIWAEETEVLYLRIHEKKKVEKTPLIIGRLE